MTSSKKPTAQSVQRAMIKRLVAFYCLFKGLTYRILLSDNRPLIRNSKILQPTQFVGKGKIIIMGARLGVWPSPALVSGTGYIEARSTEAIVEIHSSTAINNSFVIIADKTRIAIGERCLIGPNFFVTDSDFHGIEIENRYGGNYKCRDVKIGNDVFIGDNVRILKGVTVGDGSVIGSGSLVADDVSPKALYAGVPAKKIREFL